MHAIAEEDDEGIAGRIDPDRGPGKSRVAERAQGKQVAFVRRKAGRDVPTQTTRRAVLTDRMWAGHRRYAQRTQNARAVVVATAQNHLAVNREVVSRGKQTRVARNAAHPKRSGIVHLTAQPLLAFRPGTCATIAEIVHLPAALFGRRNSRHELRVGTKARVAHSERPENIL